MISFAQSIAGFMKKQIKVALIGFGFMGRAHSDAYSKVNNFFDLAYEPVLKVVSTPKRKVGAVRRSLEMGKHRYRMEASAGERGYRSG